MLEVLLTAARDGSLEKDIHFFSFDDLNIILDVNSGAISLSDEITMQILKAALSSGGDKELFHCKTNFLPAHKIAGVLRELHSLYKENLFLSKDSYEKHAHRSGEKVLKSLCLHVSHDCNLRCRYCFAGTGSFGGERKHMTPAAGKRALLFLLEHSGERKNCEVDFFGGEPLLNFKTVKEIVGFGREAAKEKGKEFRFTLTTNGVLLTKEVQDFLNKEKVSVVLSLDGRKEVHDYMRPFPNGRGSYDHIVPVFKEFVASRGGSNYYLRGTFTRRNIDFSKDVLHLFDLGFDIVSVEPVVAPPSEDFAFCEEDKPRIEKEYRKLARELVKRKKENANLEFFHFNVDFEKGTCLPKRLTGCGAGYQYMAVTPDGKLYPCHQFVGNRDFLLGDVWTGVNNDHLVEQFAEAHIYNKECRNCWARFFCSGGCHANAFHFNGDIKKPYSLGCFMQKVRLECALYIFIKEKLRVLGGQ